VPIDATAANPRGTAPTGVADVARHRESAGGRVRRAGAALVAFAVLGAGWLVWDASQAAFTRTTANTGNSWTAGQVTLTNDSGTAMFTASGLVPGSTDSRCITVTYAGNVAAAVKLYATNYTGTLGQYLDLTVQMGTGGSFGSCTGFSPSSTVYSGTLDGFRTAATNYNNGVGSFSAPSGTSRVYRFTYTLQNDDAAAGQTATCGFTWEAQNT
jgi:hypothetical protein